MTDIAVGGMYEPLQQLLISADAMVGAAEFHGLIVGALCGQIEQQHWLEMAKVHLDVPGQWPTALQVTSEEMFALAGRQLAARDFQFQLLLPTTHVELELVLRNLSEWVTGFLQALGESQLTLKNLDASAAELLDDLAVITQITVDEGGSEEADLIEVIEYVRIAVFNLYEECHQLAARSQPPSRLH